MGDTNSPSNEHYLREGLDVIDIGSADSSLSPLVKLCLKHIHIDCYVYKLCNILYIILLKFHALFKVWQNTTLRVNTYIKLLHYE